MKIDKNIYYVENFYCVPHLNASNKKLLTEHLEEQCVRYDRYFCGGDFNINWKSKKERSCLEISGLTQYIKDVTRVAKRTNKTTNTVLTSKTLIDLVLCNEGCEVVGSGTSEWSTKDKFSLNKDGERVVEHGVNFDHKSVYVNIESKKSQSYRSVTFYPNHMNRPVPDQNDVVAINKKIDCIDTSSITCYDQLISLTGKILDEYVPKNQKTPKTQKIYDVPLTKELLAEIKEKHRLDKLSVRDPDKYLDKYRKKRNRLSLLIKKQRKKYYKDVIDKCKNAEDICHKIKCIQSGLISNMSGNPDVMQVGNLKGEALATESAKFYKSRAEDLVLDPCRSLCGPPPPPLRDDESLPNTLDFEFPTFDNFNDYIPKNKESNSAGPAGISPKVLSLIWPSFRTKLNEVVRIVGLKYPTQDVGYYQRMIPKVSGMIMELKQLRPLGILNALEKYFFNKVFFKAVREHISDLLKKRHNYSYTGTHMCIITTLDRVLDDIHAGKKTMVTKYDFSNAFGTINHTVLTSVLKQLNLSEPVLNYFCEYLENQKMAKTVISDKSGIYTSDFVSMEKGTVQGQIGSDLCFIIQQLCLRPLDEVFRTLYVDDLNDVISATSEFAAISTATANERALIAQSLQVCFKINDDKTTYIPFNIDDSFLKLAKLKIKRRTEILGFPFLAGPCGPDVSPAADMIIERLLEKSRIVHACRAYFNDPLTRVMIARQIIYHCIGEIHLVFAYDKTGAEFNKIRVKVNSVLRATGLTNKTPTMILDKVLGTNLQKFAEHCIISTGLRIPTE